MNFWARRGVGKDQGQTLWRVGVTSAKKEDCLWTMYKVLCTNWGCSNCDCACVLVCVCVCVCVHACVRVCVCVRLRS